MKTNTQLLIIDPQNDFHDQDGASLGVPGSMADAARLSEVINKNQRAFSNINVTMDTHQLVDIAHPIMWVDSKGRNPDPFTIISVDDVKNGTWRAFNPAYQKRLLSYVEQLEANNRYPLCIWPPHTLIGSWGFGVVDSIYKSILDWEQSKTKPINFVTKGSNIFTENYSAIQADVPDPTDPTTQLNTQLIQTLEESDTVFISGQALSHCIANTVRDIANNFGDDSIKKLVLIEDTSSPVPGFENLADDFMVEMKGRGMQTIKAAQIDI